MELMYQIPSEPNVSRCIITKDVVEKGAEPKIEYSDRKMKSSASKKRMVKSNPEIA